MPEDIAWPEPLTDEVVEAAIDRLLRRESWETITIKIVLRMLAAELLPAGSDAPLKPFKKYIGTAVDEAMARITEERKAAVSFALGQVVWAKMSGYPYWPGRVVKPRQGSALERQVRKERDAGGEAWLVKFFFSDDLLVCPAAALESWEVGCGKGWREAPSQSTGSKLREGYLSAVGRAEAALREPAQEEEEEEGGGEEGGGEEGGGEE